MPKAKRGPSGKFVSRGAAAPRTVTQAQPRAEIVVFKQPNAVAKRPQRRSGLLDVMRGGGSKTSLVPIRETIQGSGGGLLAGLADDLMPKKWSEGSRTGRAALVLGSVTLLAWATGMPGMVVAGAAGGVARKLYDDVTSVI